MSKPMNFPLIGGVSVIVVAVILSLSGFKIPSKSTATNSTLSTNSSTAMPVKTDVRLPDSEINAVATMTTDRGDIVIQLDPIQGPLAASNFVTLVKQGFYDGIIWHRREEGFVIQAGDPLTKNPDISQELWGTGGPGYTIPDEPVTGEYTAGTVAMARTPAPNSAGSQFFIMLSDRIDLAKSYVIFGKVIQGMEVVQAIQKGDKIVKVTLAPLL